MHTLIHLHCNPTQSGAMLAGIAHLSACQLAMVAPTLLTADVRPHNQVKIAAGYPGACAHSPLLLNSGLIVNCKLLLVILMLPCGDTVMNTVFLPC